MEGLGRINLLVGTNNSGKTSVLEALHLLSSNGDPGIIWRIASQRGERIETESQRLQPLDEVDICHLFRGHELKPTPQFTISAKNDGPERRITFSIKEATSDDQLEADQEELIVPRMILAIEGRPAPVLQRIPLTRRGGVSSTIADGSRRPRRRDESSRQPALYISTKSLSVSALMTFWNRVVLTTAEDLVLRALRFLEPRIERIAAVSTSSYYYRGDAARGGFVVKLSGVDNPIPIGSLGDGTWRMLALAIALTRVSHGILLIDEIDTGLHYTVMADMWRLVDETARRLNVQVFATTHSYDCVKSLAAICDPDALANNHVTIQRINSSKSKAVAYTEAEIKVAAERHIEVR